MSCWRCEDVSKVFRRDGINDEARSWVLLLDQETVSKERLAELRSWLRVSPAHRKAFEKAASAWLDMDKLSSLLQRPALSSVQLEHALEKAEQPRGLQTLPVRSPQHLRSAFQVAAATVLLAAFATALTFFSGTAGSGVVAYETATGQVKTVTLSDGSMLQLNSGSLVRVAYQKDARRLQLLAGEAYCEVAPNPQRPFLVYTGRFAVRAVGTAFTVQRLDAGVDVTVTQGHVELASFPKPVASITETAPARAGPEGNQKEESRYSVVGGQHIVVANNVKILEQIDARTIGKRLAWRNGMLLFDDDPLTDVVAEIGRYTSQHIVITDPSIRDLKIGGYFRVSDIDLIFDTFRDNFGIEVTRGEDQTVYLSHRRSTR